MISDWLAPIVGWTGLSIPALLLLAIMIIEIVKD